MKTLTRAGAFWKDADGNWYAWSDGDEPIFTNVENGDAVVLIEIVNDDEVLVG